MTIGSGWLAWADGAVEIARERRATVEVHYRIPVLVQSEYTLARRATTSNLYKNALRSFDFRASHYDHPSLHQLITASCKHTSSNGNSRRAPGSPASNCVCSGTAFGNAVDRMSNI